MKAHLPWSNEPQYRTTGDGVRSTAGVVYVGNIHGHNENRFRIGAQFPKKEILMHQGAKPATGFQVGDAFVFYKTGTGIVIRRTQRSKKAVHLYPMTQAERKLLAKEIRQAERELRWRSGSYCENERRKKIATRVRRQASQERARLKRKHGN